MVDRHRERMRAAPQRPFRLPSPAVSDETRLPPRLAILVIGALALLSWILLVVIGIVAAGLV